jgi:hypothetical protein
MAKPTEWRVTHEHAGPKAYVPWRPGFALPAHWKVQLSSDQLPYDIELELDCVDREVVLRSLRYIARETETPITARRMREIPVTSCVQLATAAVALKDQSRPGEIVLVTSTSDIAEKAGLAKPAQNNERYRRVAEIYSTAPKRPTRAVQDAFAWISYSTAAAWVREARNRDFLPPSKRARSRRSSAAKPADHRQR